MWTEIAPGLVRDYPFGIGYRSLSNELMRKYAKTVEPGRNHLHSNVMQVLVETGWLGLAVYLGWMVWVMVVSIQRVLRCNRGPPEPLLFALALLAMFLALLCNGVVEYNFGDTEILIMYAFIMGVLRRTLYPGKNPTG